MPIYTTVSRVNDQLRFVSSATGITSAQRAGFIDDAENLINAKLSVRYAVPFGVNSVPPLVETMAAKLAASYLYTFMAVKEVNLNEKLLERLEAPLGLLDMLASGDMSLVDSAGTEIGLKAAVVPQSTTENYKPVFDMRGVEVQGVDSDLIDDEDSASA